MNLISKCDLEHNIQTYSSYAAHKRILTGFQMKNEFFFFLIFWGFFLPQNPNCVSSTRQLIVNIVNSIQYKFICIVLFTMGIINTEYLYK